MVRSRLGQSLLRLESSLVESRRDEQQAVIALAEWRERWLGHRDRIARRLELIETQLDELTGVVTAAGPQFSIVGGAADDQLAESLD